MTVPAMLDTCLRQASWINGSEVSRLPGGDEGGQFEVEVGVSGEAKTLEILIDEVQLRWDSTVKKKPRIHGVFPITVL